MPRSYSIDRRSRGNGTRGRPERVGRARRQALPRPDGHAGERLSRSAIGRIEPAAFVGWRPVGARPAVWHFSPGGAGVQAGAERLLDVSCRPDETEPGGQGAHRPQAGPLRRRFASGSSDPRTERHPACGDRSRESDRHRFSHAVERSHRQPRPHGFDHREASCRGPPAMSELWAQEAARSPPYAGAARARRGRQGRHDERRVPQRFAVGHGGAFPQAREPAHRRRLASRADPGRFAHEHQLLCHAQFFWAGGDGSSAQGGLGRRQFRQGQHRRTGRSQRAHGGDRALFRDFSGRRDPGKTAVCRFPVRRGHSSQRCPAVQRRTIAARPGADERAGGDAGALRSIGKDRMVAGLVSARRALQISSDQPVVFLLPGRRWLRRGFPMAARPATRSRRRSSRDSSSWWKGTPTRSGGTIGCSGRSWTSASSTIPMFAICKSSWPRPAAGFGSSK